MPKGPKYKRGFTFRHHFDEWWDRRPHEWKVRLFVSMGFAGLITALVLVYFLHQWMERDAILAEAKTRHENRLRNMDRQMVSEPGPEPKPSLQQSAQLEVRPGQ